MIEPSEPPHVPPGERLPAETSKAYAAFRLYLEAGPTRSVVAVAEECNKSASLLWRWSSQWRWQARAEAWDAAMRTTYENELRDARRESAHTHVRVAREALKKVEERLTGLAASDLSPSDVMKLWDVAAKIEREVLGEPRRVEVSGPDRGPLPLALVDLDDETRRERMHALRRELDQRLAESDATQPPSTTPPPEEA